MDMTAISRPRRYGSELVCNMWVMLVRVRAFGR
jgi:hypothetical protein